MLEESKKLINLYKFNSISKSRAIEITYLLTYLHEFLALFESSCKWRISCFCLNQSIKTSHWNIFEGDNSFKFFRRKNEFRCEMSERWTGKTRCWGSDSSILQRKLLSSSVLLQYLQPDHRKSFGPIQTPSPTFWYAFAVIFIMCVLKWKCYNTEIVYMSFKVTVGSY